jgi:hypothetical protein
MHPMIKSLGSSAGAIEQNAESASSIDAGFAL